MADDLKIFSGNGCPELAREIADYIKIPLGAIEVPATLAAALQVIAEAAFLVGLEVSQREGVHVLHEPCMRLRHTQSLSGASACRSRP